LHYAIHLSFAAVKHQITVEETSGDTTTGSKVKSVGYYYLRNKIRVLFAHRRPDEAEDKLMIVYEHGPIVTRKEKPSSSSTAAPSSAESGLTPMPASFSAPPPSVQQQQEQEQQQQQQHDEANN
jgi:hypothetical protein